MLYLHRSRLIEYITLKYNINRRNISSKLRRPIFQCHRNIIIRIDNIAFRMFRLCPPPLISAGCLWCMVYLWSMVNHWKQKISMTLILTFAARMRCKWLTSANWHNYYWVVSCFYWSIISYQERIIKTKSIKNYRSQWFV